MTHDFKAALKLANEALASAKELGLPTKEYEAIIYALEMATINRPIDRSCQIFDEKAALDMAHEMHEGNYFNFAYQDSLE